MPHPTAVLNVAGLSGSLIGEHTPNLSALCGSGRQRRLKPMLPAVTCSVQSSMLTGAPPRDHGIVGNGWYDRDLAEIQFWKQSNRLVRGEKVWETARRRENNVYADRDGNVYRRSGQGWEQRDRDGWSGADQRAGQRSGDRDRDLDRQHNARQRGAQRTNNYQRSSGQRGGGGRRGGGRRR